MQLEERVVGDVTILALSGRMTRDEKCGVYSEGPQPGTRWPVQAGVELGGSFLYG